LNLYHSRLVFTKTRLLLLLFCTLPAALPASLNVQVSDENGVSFRYVPGQVRLTDSPGGRQVVDFDDADHLAQPGEPDLPGKTVRVGIPQTGGVRLNFRTGPERSLQSVRLATVPHMSWNGDSSWYDELPDSRGSLAAAGRSRANRGPAQEQVRDGSAQPLPVRPGDERLELL